MSLANSSSSPVVLRLNRDLTRIIKRGHPWVYADTLRDLPSAPAGTEALLLDNKKGQPIARGFYDHDCLLALRICETDPDKKLDDRWVERRLRVALALRHAVFHEGHQCGDSVRGGPILNAFKEDEKIQNQGVDTLRSPGTTTGYRLINGEGDGMPGLIVDRYGETAVVKLDGYGPTGFWNADAIGSWLACECQFTSVYQRFKERGSGGRSLHGPVPDEPPFFFENGLQFAANVVAGQKTGFFLDQRDNRHFIRTRSRDARVLNMFAYSGGFSVAAGIGNATTVTSVDFAPLAIEEAEYHWDLNGLAYAQHTAVVADAFEFLTQAAHERQRWNIVILDPPSFAPNQESVKAAMSAYCNLIEKGTRVTASHGMLAVASCSSHIDLPAFLSCCEEGVSKGRRRATVLTIAGQPFDHPTPLALPEFRYLKFVAMQLD